MKRKEKLRGKEIKNICIDDIVNLSLIEEKIEKERKGECIEYTNNEQKIIIHANIDTNNSVLGRIRKDILSSYNCDINDTYVLCFLFMKWYKKVLRRVKTTSEKKEEFTCSSILSIILDCEQWLSQEERNMRNEILSEKKDDIYSYILREKIRFYNRILKLIGMVEQSDQIAMDVISKTISNCLYIQLISENKEIDNYFILEWIYYPVNSVFQSVIAEFDNELTKVEFIELHDNEKKYYDIVVNGNVKFDSLKEIEIKKESKKRKVYIVTNTFEKVVLNYLAKRLKIEFDVVFPNRDKIMEVAFNLIDSLPQLEEYTVYKFDFSDFFNSVDMRLVYDNYIDKSNLYNYEKELIKKFANKYKKCIQGIPISNVLVEIIAREFDVCIHKIFSTQGLVFYKRYVDDCILIFNRRVEETHLEKHIVKICKEVFDNKVKLSKKKTSYQTKYLGDASFDYLGYSFERACWQNPNPKKSDYYYFKFGIAENKIKKYEEQLNKIFEAYEVNGNEKLLLRRLQYFNSRVVFYNYNGSKYNNSCTWDVRGIINTYRMLRRYVIYDSNITGKKNEHQRINNDTYDFMKYYVCNRSKLLSTIPVFLRGKGSDNHTLWNGFIKNRSIVFQPNIGWSNQHINNRLSELGVTIIGKSYYQKSRDYSSLMIKKL